jgi:hypothetical protein
MAVAVVVTVAEAVMVDAVVMAVGNRLLTVLLTLTEPLSSLIA